MKFSANIILFIALLLCNLTQSAQVVITTDGSPSAISALLDVQSTSKGVLIPRLTNSERDDINSPETGLIIFNTETKTLQIFNGNLWSMIIKTNCGMPFYDAVNDKHYRTVRIGSQCWMAENLASINYNDDSSIPQVGDPNTWSNLTTPGLCWYNNDDSNEDTYGIIYNWYAVNTGNLCPVGWHVPTDAEWTTLQDYLIASGYNYDGTTSDNKIAKAMASYSNWYSSTSTGTPGNTDYPEYRNKSAFKAMPGGWRTSSGTFYDLGFYGYWWSATQYNAINAFFRNLYNQSKSLYGSSDDKKTGSSVRCIKN
jgi:uncharacterized protein (TIGR02145 family)